MSGLRILRKRGVVEKVGLKGSTLYALMGRGLFPRPVQLAGQSTVGWVEDEIDAWLAARVARRDAKVPDPPPAAKRRRGRPRKGEPSSAKV
jgi:prophage regulatory protein